MGAIVRAWLLIAAIARAAVRVPVGLVLLWLAYVIALLSDGNWLILLLAAWIGYHGGNFVFGTLGWFTSAPETDAPGRASFASRWALRRRGLIRR
jgi:hypothetical protein